MHERKIQLKRSEQKLLQARHKMLWREVLAIEITERAKTFGDTGPVKYVGFLVETTSSYRYGGIAVIRW